jgi:hypothetical protein
MTSHESHRWLLTTTAALAAMTAVRRGFLALLVGLVVGALLPSPLHADATRKRCLRDCARSQRECLATARARRAQLAAACPSGPACRNAIKATVGGARSLCRQFRRECRACCRAGGQGPDCPIGRPVPFEPPPPPDLAATHLPQLPDGRFVVLVIPGAQLLLDPLLRTPVTALGACTGWITSCVDPSARSLDDCARSTPPCLTDRPWEEPAACCSAGCFTAYEAVRRAGTESLTAFAQVYFEDAQCFPGVRELLAGEGS